MSNPSTRESIEGAKRQLESALTWFEPQNEHLANDEACRQQWTAWLRHAKSSIEEALVPCAAQQKTPR